MIDHDAAWVASAAGGRLVAGDLAAPGPLRAVVDSRAAGRGDLFVGIPGERADGGLFAQGALDAGAWGAIVTPEHAGALTGGVAIAAADPLVALQSLARAWRRDLGARVVGVTGSTGKTSTKDILATLLRSQLLTHANRENLNTEIGLPLTILEAERGTEAMVLEMAMRGSGQIAELVAIAEPDVGLIVNVGPVHLEVLGTIENVAAAKAELIRDLRPGAVAVVPFGEQLLVPHLRDDVETLTFGRDGGDVRLVSFDDGRATIDASGRRVELELGYSEPHNVLNTVAAVAAASALGLEPSGRVDVRFSSLRGEVVELDGGVTVVNDCYNANPMSMRAALEHLASTPAERHVAVLGTMAELGPEGPRFHREIGELSDRLGIDVLITVGEAALPIGEPFDGERYAAATPEEAGSMLEELARPGDRVLVKGSRSVGLERVLGSAAKS
ncbi:MAG: UDP-N-acetylmuramoyl-tripeptide--D-alanyl-D-alanine ligase [Thermoleophilaceae bacterium]|nr:UDP-N-acetylmuramoyl-tripeptide--D-alanyl-D-alanine ligase [Thermoleophilaceae bacterium]